MVQWLAAARLVQQLATARLWLSSWQQQDYGSVAGNNKTGSVAVSGSMFSVQYFDKCNTDVKLCVQACMLNMFSFFLIITKKKRRKKRHYMPSWK